VTNDSQVSSRHLQVIPQGNDYLLVDVGSSNGTVFNGAPLPPQMPQVLHNGDVIVVGTTRIMVELSQATFMAAPPPTMPAGPAQPGFLPSEQMGFPQAPFAPAPNYGPQAQPPMPQAQPGMPPANAFGSYAAAPPGQAPGYYPGGGWQGGPPGGYQGAPGMGVGAPPARKGNRRLVLLISGILVVLVILGGSALAVFLLTHQTPSGPGIPNATTQVVTPFYNNLKSQNYQAATKLFTADYLEQHDGEQHYIETIFQPLDTIRGAVTAFQVQSVKPVNGSSTNEVALVKVTRDPAKGTFDPDMLILVYEKGKWQISQWQPGQRQSGG
jgi:hypothetical protein